MLAIEIVPAEQVERAATIFHRDGFVAISGALTPEQLRKAQAGAQRVIKQQTDADPKRKGNRGSFRYSFDQQIHEPEWQMLVDLPAVLPILSKIWGSEDYAGTGAGGDYSLPGAQMQVLHSDIPDFFRDPYGLVTYRDVPAPFIVVNYMMVEFTRENGAIRFVPGTQRSRASIPTLEEEPQWMRDSIVCAPAGTAVIRDVRCWHGGTANTSAQTRPMTSAGYTAPWFRFGKGEVPRSVLEKMSPTARRLCRYYVSEE